MASRLAVRCGMSALRLGYMTCVLLAVVSGATQSTTAKPVGLLGGISRWNYKLAKSRLPRVWTDRALALGVAHRGNLQTVQRLLDKLNNRQPIVATIFGSSFVKTAAGCFHATPGALWQHGIVPNPTIYPCGVPALEEAHTGGCVGACGFMTAFMATLNATWPHPGHILFNQGRSGTCLDALYRTSCMDALIPKKVDLVVLDTVTIHGSMEGGEALLTHLLRWPSRPLVLLLSNGRACDMAYSGGRVRDDMRCAACLKHLRQLAEGGKQTASTAGSDPCALPGAQENLFSTPSSWQQRKVSYWQRLAKHYDVSHLNLHTVMSHIMQQADKLVPALGLPSRAHLLAQFYWDHVHLNRERWGTLLTADLLVYYLASAQLKLSKASGMVALASATARPLPSTTVYMKDSMLYQTRCYGLDVHAATQAPRDGAQQRTTGGAQHQQLPQQQRLQATTAALAQVSPTGNASTTLDYKAWAQSTLTPYPPLCVVESHDFFVQVFHRNGHGDLKIRPGYLATSAGARLVWELDTTFGTATGKRGLSTTEVLVAYLRSYRIWGMAQVTCVSGCSCTPVTLDALSDEDTSVSHAAAVPVTPHPACRMALEVLAKTRSQGHSFKLLSVGARAGR